MCKLLPGENGKERVRRKERSFASGAGKEIRTDRKKEKVRDFGAFGGCRGATQVQKRLRGSVQVDWRRTVLDKLKVEKYKLLGRNL